MIATDRFVYVHPPKTGGTFVTAVLMELADRLGTRHVQMRTWRRPFVPAKLKHGTCRDIPHALRGLPIWSTVRNPYDHYVSEYAFGWWRRDDLADHFARHVPDFARSYPRYPDLSFAEFLQLYHAAFGTTDRSRAFAGEGGVGWLTERFVRYFARRPDRLLPTLRPDHDPAAFRTRLFPVRFLRMERLNRVLAEALAGAGVADEHAARVLDRERVRPAADQARPRTRDWRDYYTPDLEAQVRRNDALLFRLFPAYDAP